MSKDELTFAEQTFTGELVELFTLHTSDDGTMLGLQISTAGGKTHRVVFAGPVLMPTFLSEVAKATTICASRQGLETLDDLMFSMSNRT